MDIHHSLQLPPPSDPDASLTFYRDVLGFQVRNDVGYEDMRWITVDPSDQPGTSIVLQPPTADPGVTDDERRTITEMMARGTQDYGVRDCAVRDPAGNLIRIHEQN